MLLAEDGTGDFVVKLDSFFGQKWLHSLEYIHLSYTANSNKQPETGMLDVLEKASIRIREMEHEAKYLKVREIFAPPLTVSAITFITYFCTMVFLIELF